MKPVSQGPHKDERDGERETSNSVGLETKASHLSLAVACKGDSPFLLELTDEDDTCMLVS